MAFQGEIVKTYPDGVTFEVGESKIPSLFKFSKGGVGVVHRLRPAVIGIVFQLITATWRQLPT